MTKNDSNFDTWFDILKINVLERTGVEFRDQESVINDYNNGKNVYDSIDDIVSEYSEIE